MFAALGVSIGTEEDNHELNIEKLRYGDSTQLLRCDWKQAVLQLKGTEPFDLVFLDPPYRMTELPECCAVLADAGLLAEDAMLVLEHRTGVFTAPDERFALCKERV